MAKGHTPGNELQEQGFKLTRQRRELLAVLQESPAMLSAEDIHQRVQASQPGVSLSTIYRNLELLTQLSLICKLDLGDGQARYEYRRAGTHHHHLICLGCGRTEHLDCPLATVSQLVGDRKFTITGHRFEVYGYCQTCRPA